MYGKLRIIALLGIALAGSTVTRAHAEEGSAEAPAPDALSAGSPAALWENLGCVDCHGEDGPYHDKLKGALGKPVDDVARWVRNAPSIKPGTAMPSFESLLTRTDSRALAAWVQGRASSMR